MALMRVPVPDGRGRVSRQRRLGGVVATVAVVVVSALGAPAASAQMRAGLWLDVFVEDADGAPVTDLRRGDFVVDQGGALGRIIDAELVEWPLRLVILLEDSDRLAGYLAHLRIGLPRFVDELPEGSEVELVFFATRPRTLVEATIDLDAVQDGLGQYFARRGAPNVFDAFSETVERLYTDFVEWPVIVTVTGDGTPRVPTRRARQLVEQVVETGTTVHALVLNTQGATHQTGVARRLSELTDGWLAEVNSPSGLVVRKLVELGELVAERAAARPARYLVTFEPPPNADPEAEIALAVRRSQVRVQVRGQPESRER